MGRGPASRGPRFLFAAGARRAPFFAAGARQVHSLTSEHPLQKDIQGPGHFFCCGCASLLTHSPPAARSTHSKKAPTTKTKNTGSVSKGLRFRV